MPLKKYVLGKTICAGLTGEQTLDAAIDILMQQFQTWRCSSRDKLIQRLRDQQS